MKLHIIIILMLLALNNICYANADCKIEKDKLTLCDLAVKSAREYIGSLEKENDLQMGVIKSQDEYIGKLNDRITTYEERNLYYIAGSFLLGIITTTLIVKSSRP